MAGFQVTAEVSISPATLPRIRSRSIQVRRYPQRGIAQRIATPVRNEIWGPIGDGGGAGKDLCHLVVNLQNSIKHTQRKHNEKRWIWALNSATFGTTTDSQDKVMKRDSSFLLRRG